MLERDGESCLVCLSGTVLENRDLINEKDGCLSSVRASWAWYGTPCFLELLLDMVPSHEVSLKCGV